MPTELDDRTVPLPDAVDWSVAVARTDFAKLTEDQFPTLDDRSVVDQPFSVERSQILRADVKYLSSILRQLVELWCEDEQDEYGILRPTLWAFNLACELLIDTTIVLGKGERVLPRGNASTSDRGGVRIEWRRPSCAVHLIVPPNRDGVGYIYHESGKDYATDAVTVENLAYWLRNLIEEP